MYGLLNYIYIHKHVISYSSLWINSFRAVSIGFEVIGPGGVGGGGAGRCSAFLPGGFGRGGGVPQNIKINQRQF